MEELIVLVDEHNNEVGYGEKIEVHRKEILHRAFSIFIYDTVNKKMLIQQRASQKYHSGNCWSNSCCSHQRKGETLQESLKRCIQDELGIELLVDNQYCGRFHYYAPYEDLSEHELDNVFLYCVDDNFSKQNIPFNPEEIQALQWIDLEELNTWLQKRPEDFSAWFSRAYALVLETLNK